MPGTDPDDRQHMAAALAGGADTIVTWNRKDFPGLELARHGIRVIDPDEYLVELLGEIPNEILYAIQQMAARRRRPPMTVREVVERLAKANVSNFAIRLQDLLALVPSEDEMDPERMPASEARTLSSWIQPREIRQRLIRKRPPPYSASLRVPRHQPVGRNAHSRFIEATMAEVLEFWPQGTVVTIDYRNQTYAQALIYPPHILTEIGPVSPDRMKAAVKFGWLDPSTFQTRHADFKSQPVWEDNPVREWEHPIDSLHDIGLFIQGRIFAESLLQ